MSSPPMAELVSCCFSLYLLLVKNRFVLSDLAGRLSSCQVWGHCISWSRGIENTVNIPSLQMPGCSFLVSWAIQGPLLPRILKGLSPYRLHQPRGLFLISSLFCNAMISCIFLCFPITIFCCLPCGNNSTRQAQSVTLACNVFCDLFCPVWL